ncbi:hypothetical protein VYU27_001522 [Nannochloropsis oceanica]
MLRLTIYSCRKASAASGPRLGRVLFGCNTDHQQSIGRAIVAAAATAAVLVVCNPPAASSSASATDTHTTIATTVTTLPTKKRGQQQHKAYVWGDIRWLQVPSSSSSPSYSSSTNAITTTPLPLPFTNVRALAFGPSFAAALLQDGSVQWKSAQTEKFMPLALPRGERAVKVECTSEKIYVLTSSGRVFFWSITRLIRRTVSSSSSSSPLSSPSPVPPSEYASLAAFSNSSSSSTIDSHVVITSLSAGHQHVLMTTAEGTVLGVGSNGQGQLGLPSSFSRVTLEEPRELPFFLPPSLPPSLRPVRVVAGHAHSFVVCMREGGREGGKEVEERKVFSDLPCFEAAHGDIKDHAALASLQATIRPYLLRRMKEDVEKGLPPKEETLIDVELTGVQKQYYRALYEKNAEFLLGGRKAVDGPSLMNLCMELRKCCNHPFLNRGVELDIRSHAEATGKVYRSDADLLVEYR